MTRREAAGSLRPPAEPYWKRNGLTPARYVDQGRPSFLAGYDLGVSLVMYALTAKRLGPYLARDLPADC